MITVLRSRAWRFVDRFPVRFVHQAFLEGAKAQSVIDPGRHPLIFRFSPDFLPVMMRHPVKLSD